MMNSLYKPIFAVLTCMVMLLASPIASAQTNDVARLIPAIHYLLLDEPDVITEEDAARFLIQATYGAKYDEIQALTKSSYTSWINTQLAMQPTLLNDFMIEQDWVTPSADEDELIEPLSDSRQSSWLLVSTNADDQLRQRMAFAWSEIFVVSNKIESNVGAANRLFVDYYDTLLTHSFANFRDLLEIITLNGVMGEYLSMAGNAKASAQISRPDENYAREIMQLFTIGLWQLNVDGTQKLDNNDNPIPTYDQADVEEFAKVFTGWDQTRCATHAATCQFPSGAPMASYQSAHDVSVKRLIEVDGFNSVLSANQTAEKDLESALDLLFNHPNVGPFIGKQLIQRFVTSNPTPAYVARITRVFNNNGRGVRGDMAAVIKAILLDAEARNGHETMPNTFGKFKEPLLRITALWRALNMIKEKGGRFRGGFVTNLTNYPGQFPNEATSVFNFFQPDFSPPGVLSDNNLLAPEAQLLDLEGVVTMSEHLYLLVQQNDAEGANFNDDTNFALLYTSALQSMVPDNLKNPAELIDHLNLVLTAGAMRDDVRQVLMGLHSEGAYLAPSKLQVVLDIAQLILTSPNFAVQR